jgi:Tfp pilus assembly protein PilN
MHKKINFIDWRRNQTALNTQRFKIQAGGIILLTTVVMLSVAIVKTTELNKKLSVDNYLKVESMTLDTMVGEIGVFENTISEINSRMEVINSLQAGKSNLTLIFDGIARHTPKSIKLTNLKRVGDKVLISGETDQQLNIPIYLGTLKNVSIFKEPSIKEVSLFTSKDGIDKSIFTIDVKISNTQVAGGEKND